MNRKSIVIVSLIAVGIAAVLMGVLFGKLIGAGNEMQVILKEQAVESDTVTLPVQSPEKQEGETTEPVPSAPPEVEITPPEDAVQQEPGNAEMSTAAPTATQKPTEKPESTATAAPSATVKPTENPTVKPEATSAVKPTATAKPTATPTVKPTATPTATPTVKPTATPTVKPTATPTAKPTQKPGNGEDVLDGEVGVEDSVFD